MKNDPQQTPWLSSELNFFQNVTNRPVSDVVMHSNNMTGP